MTKKLFVVKSRVTGRLFYVGTQEFCRDIALDMNATYQTDEYYVDPWDDEKWMVGLGGN